MFTLKYTAYDYIFCVFLKTGTKLEVHYVYFVNWTSKVDVAWKTNTLNLETIHSFWQETILISQLITEIARS